MTRYLDIYAYSALAFADATRRATGVEPVTCPPVTSATIHLHDLEGHDVLWIDLHGELGSPTLYGVTEHVGWLGLGRESALTASQARLLALRGVLVFATTCYMGNHMSPLLGAFLTAGASVIAGTGPNYSPPAGPLYGAHLLGRWVLKALRAGFAPDQALSVAKKRVALALLNPTATGGVRAANFDALEFKLYH